MIPLRARNVIPVEQVAQSPENRSRATVRYGRS